jgi:predicted metalloendopeptidase
MIWLKLSLAVILLAFQNSGRFDVKRMDPTCKPCEDFYQFVNGNWIRDNPVPAAYPRWGTFQILQEDNLKILREILDDAARANAPVGTNEQIIGAFYASCMDEGRIESRGAAPIADELARIEKIDNVQSLQAEIAKFHENGMPAVFRFGASHDLKNSSQNMAWAVQAGLSLPNKDYYTKTDDKSKQTRDEFVKHVARMFELLGDKPQQAAKAADTIMRMEMELAQGSMDLVERRNPALQDNRRTVAELQRMTPDFSWTAYLKSRGLSRVAAVNVGQPKFFEGMNRMLKSAPIADWKTLLRWHVLHEAAAQLSSGVVDENFNFFNRTLTGAKELQPRWRRCVVAADTWSVKALGRGVRRKAVSSRSQSAHGCDDRKSHPRLP